MSMNEIKLWTITGRSASLVRMRAMRYLLAVAMITGLSGCACLPGGGKAQSALDALEQPSSTLSTAPDGIPSRRF